MNAIVLVLNCIRPVCSGCARTPYRVDTTANLSGMYLNDSDLGYPRFEVVAEFPSVDQAYDFADEMNALVHA